MGLHKALCSECVSLDLSGSTYWLRIGFHSSSYSGGRTQLIGPCSVRMQIIGTVDESYNTLKPYGANRADIGSIEVTGSRGAVFPQSLEINGTPCELIVSSHEDA